MNIKEFIKRNLWVLLSAAIFSGVVSACFLRTIGIKDSAMVFAATFLLCFEIYLIFKDKKHSMFLFILSFPILVTARKVVYYDFLSIKLNYESIYVTVLFFASIKEIARYISSNMRKSEGSEPWFLIYTAAFVILAFNSSMFASDALNSISIAYLGAAVPAMFMLCVASTLGKNDRKSVYFALIGGLDLSCLYGFMQIIMNRIPFREISSQRELITFGYHNTNIFAGILTLILPYMIDMILYRKNNHKEKYFLYASLFISLCALFLTYTRGAWLAFLISVFIILISRKYRMIVYGLCVAGVFMFKPALSFIVSRGSSVNTFMQDESVIARIQSIYTSLVIMLKYPFGTGAGTFADMYKKFANTGYLAMPKEFRINVNVANYMLEGAHNLWLQLGVELGILCSVIFLIIIINRLRLIFKNYSENRAGFTAIIVYLIFSVLTGIELNHKGVITETLIIWLIFAVINLSSEEGSKIEKAN